MREISVFVPDDRIPEFYQRFGEFLAETGIGGAPARAAISVPSTVPDWIDDANASELAAALWAKLSDAGREVIAILAKGGLEATPRRFTGAELAQITGHPSGEQGVVGVLGGVGRALRKTGFPVYADPGGEWHRLWHWDGRHYWIEPRMALLFKDLV